MRHLSVAFFQSLFYYHLLVLSRRASAQEGPTGACTKTETCKCKYSNDYTIDLTPLASELGPRFTNVEGGDYMYDVNLCSEFSLGQCSGVTVCQSSKDGIWSYTLGKLSGSYFSTGGSLLYYYFINGEDGRSSRILLQCDTNDDASMYAWGDSGTLEYDFTLYSKYACALAPGEDPIDPIDPPGGGGSSALTVGSILLIVFFCALIAYFVVGTLIMKFGLHAEGKAVVPQVSFWTAIPGLIKDGWLFLWHKMRGQGEGGAGGGNYEKL
eukprot:m.237662 g.237662  ORF g.237662 m.237662 type:complete len:268 (+) comp40147_c0_seq12:48-851(+)